MARVRGPFTPSQWMELEHQALIYKYLAANIPVPHNLLVPIRRSITSLYPSAYFGSSTCKSAMPAKTKASDVFLAPFTMHCIAMIKVVFD